MNDRKCLALAVLAAAFVVGTSGCQLMHELQPHRMWKWNHGSSGMPAEDYSYHPAKQAGTSSYLASVSDEPPNAAGGIR